MNEYKWTDKNKLVKVSKNLKEVNKRKTGFFSYQQYL